MTTRLDQWKALLEQATSAPWHVQTTTACHDVIQGGDRKTDQRYIAMMGQDYDAEARTDYDYPAESADAALISIAPEAVAALLTLAEAAQDLHPACERIPEGVSHTIEEWKAAQCGECASCLFNAALQPLLEDV